VLDITELSARAFLPLAARRELQLGFAAERYSLDGQSQQLTGPSARYQQDFRIAQPNDLVPEVGSAFAVDGAYLVSSDRARLATALIAWQKPYRIRWLGPHAVFSVAVEGAAVKSWRTSDYFLYAGGEESFPFSLGSSFYLPGYEPNALGAERLALVHLSFTKPVLRIERGFATVPGYLDRISIGARADGGPLWRGGDVIHPSSVGVELIAETEMSHRFPVLWKAGVYQGDAANGGRRRFVLSIGLSR
jgi:hypothetical protein